MISCTGICVKGYINIMIFSFENGVGRVKTEAYAMTLDAETIAVRTGGTEFARLDVRSALNIPGDGDDTSLDEEGAVSSFRLERSAEDCAEFVWESSSSLWEKKEYILVCREMYAEYKIRVTGSGKIDSVNYFSGSMTEDGHGSHYEFSECYAPVVSLDGSEPYTFSPIKNYDRFSYLTVPPMFLFSFRCEDEAARLTFGLVAKPGEHNFTKFCYAVSMYRWGSHFWLWTDQDGHTQVNGSWETPSVYIYRSEDWADAVQRYSDLYFELGYAKRPAPALHPRFWYGPIACGWLEQLTWNYKGEFGLLEASRQDLYEEMLEKLWDKGLHPKILIIDDKWQKEYGTAREDKEKWPDLPGFIRRAKAERGVHTLMWYRMWDNEGIPEKYCVWDDREKRFVCDPTNPGYRAILEDNLSYIISDEEGCLGADGLKIDFAFWQPVGRGAKSYSGKYGVELFLELVRLIHDTMKKIKPEAILNCSPCHPIFAGLCDQARLHDYDYRQRNCLEEFSARAALYAAALPNTLIDTDGCGYNTRRDTMRYLTRSHEIGIPDMYCVSDTPYLSLTEEDWAAVKAAWDGYEAKIDRLFEN